MDTRSEDVISLHCMIQNLELRHLRYVLAVAEELHFGKAAQRLHLAAPSLSKQIRQLEEVLGYALFERKTRSVALTAGGEAFVAESRKALKHVALAINLGAGGGRYNTDIFSVGYSPWADYGRFVPITESLSRDFPDIRIALQSGFTSTQLEHLRSGRLQAGILVQATAADDLTVATIRRDPLVVAIPEGHHLAHRESLAVSDLSREPIIWIARSVEPALANHLVMLFEASGHTPKVVHEIIAVSDAVDLVAVGLGITFISASVATRWNVKGVVFRRCSEPHFAFDVGIAYKRGFNSEILAALIHLLRSEQNQVKDNPSLNDLDSHG